MINPQILLDIANFILFIGIIPMLITVIGDYGRLKGFSLRGSVMTALAMIFILGYLWMIKAWISFGMTLVTLLYWIIVVVSLVNQDGQLEDGETEVKTSYIY